MVLARRREARVFPSVGQECLQLCVRPMAAHRSSATWLHAGATLLLCRSLRPRPPHRWYRGELRTQDQCLHRQALPVEEFGP